MATIRNTHLSEREPLSSKMIQEARMQFTKYNRADLAGYTWTHERSSYQGAKRDLVVYNPAGDVAFVGREFDRTFFWLPDPEPTGFVNA